MNTDPHPSLDPARPWLAADEPVRVECQLDLTKELTYGSVVLLLTDRRLIELGELVASTTRAPQNTAVRSSWTIASNLSLRSHEQGGLGALELVDAERRLAVWHYTSAKNPAVARLVKDFNRLAEHGAQPQEETRTVCPQCGKVLPEGETECAECTISAVPPPARSLLRLWQFAAGHVGMVGLGLALTLAATWASLVPPLLTMPLMDRVLIPRQENQVPVDFTLVAWLLAGLAGAALAAWLLGWGRKYVLAWVSERMAADIRHATYSHLLRLSPEYFGGKRTGDLISRVGSDSDRICNFLSMNVVDFIADTVKLALTAAILLSIDWKLALAVLVPFPVIAWLTQLVRDRLRHGFGRGYNAWDQLMNVLTDTIPGIRVVKAFAQEEREIDRFDRTNDHVVDMNDKVNQVWAFFSPTVTLLTEIGLLTVWAFGAWRVAGGDVTTGVLVGFFMYMGPFYARLESLTGLLAATERAAAATHRIFEILDRTPSVPDPIAPVHSGRLAGAIELEAVTFKYGPRQVIHGIDLAIAPGEMIGLVGHSGAGKTTMINLICRFFDVASGSIKVDGVDIRRYPVEEYRSNIGIVLQEPFLFYGTVAENIAYGKPDATRGEIIAAARAAHAHEFILRLADGYDSIVGERGQSLSGGERQRISIARALLIDPRILILDEATSSVDTETEREIQAALENLIRGRTTIAIAHRLSTLRRADRLVVLERGRIVEVGTHDELLAAGGEYATFHEAQTQ